jgi:zeaxanthin glucosyltransferase
MNIGFFLWPERGGLYPTFKLARELLRHGHRITYFGLQEFAAEVEGQGFAYVKVLANRLLLFDPTETLAIGSVEAKKQNKEFYASEGFRECLRLYCEEEIVDLINQHTPDVVIIDALLNRLLCAKLIRNGIRTVQIHTSLIGRSRSVPPITSSFVPKQGTIMSWLWCRALWIRTWLGNVVIDNALARRFRTFVLSRKLPPELRVILRRAVVRDEKDAKKLGLRLRLRGRGFLFNLPELVLCAREFDFPSAREEWIYAGACVDTERREPPFEWTRLPQNKRLIYVSLGTHVFYYSNNERFFKTIMSTATQNPDLFFVVSVGKGRDLTALASLIGPIPLNVMLVDFAPQLALLRRASLMITNGGLGTIKECILAGVPMLIYPCAFDQNGNSARVVFHKLGCRGRMSNITTKGVTAALRRCLEDDEFATNLKRMSAALEDPMLISHAVKWIERLGNCYGR